MKTRGNRWLLGLAMAALLGGPGGVQAGYTNLHEFAGGAGDGEVPLGALALSGTTLYGMTVAGGVSNKGVVFQLGIDGTGYTNLHAFAGGANDGVAPFGSLTLSGTTLYGMTFMGGVSNGGVVFQMQADGSGYTNLHAFAGGVGDGAGPYGLLTLSGTALYGMTFSGGASNKGVIFQLHTDGTGYTNLHAFAGGAGDGAGSYGSLTLSGTTLYGMTRNGGASNSGVVFQLGIDGTGYTNLHAFAGGAGDGAEPYGTLTLSGTTLYGMTSSGGTSNGGVVFQLHTDGSGYTNLHAFAGGADDGANPLGMLTLSGTTLSGMTIFGGTSNGGVVFQLHTDGSGYTNLHAFTGGAGDGATPYLGAAPTLSGTQLYAVTYMGGASNGGVVFALTVPSTANFTLRPAQVFFQAGGGQVASWLLDTNGMVQATRLLGSAGKWQLLAAGDVDGDGVSDLLFQSATGDIAGWLLSATGSVRSVINWGNVGAWRLRAAADYAGEGHAQLFFQAPDGQVAFWHLSTNGLFRSAEVLVPAGGWRLCAALSHTVDGPADLYWQTARGQVVVWRQLPGGGVLAQLIGGTGAWHLCGAVQMDGEGGGDLLWQTAEGNTASWFMNTNGTQRATHSWGNTGGWALKAGGR